MTSTRVDALRWGATRWVKWWVRWFGWLDPAIAETREERARWREYHLRLQIYRAELAAWRAGRDPRRWHPPRPTRPRHPLG